MIQTLPALIFLLFSQIAQTNPSPRATPDWATRLDLKKLDPIQPDLLYINRESYLSTISSNEITIIAFHKDHHISSLDHSFYMQILPEIRKLKSKNLQILFAYYTDIIDTQIEMTQTLNQQSQLKIFYNQGKEVLTYTSRKSKAFFLAYLRRLTRDTKTKKDAYLLKNLSELDSTIKNVDLFSVFIGDYASSNYQVYLEAMNLYQGAYFCRTHDRTSIERILNITRGNQQTKISGPEKLTNNEIFMFNGETLSLINGATMYKHNSLEWKAEGIISSLKKLKKNRQITVLMLARVIYHITNRKDFILLADAEKEPISEKQFQDFCRKNMGKKLDCYYYDRYIEDIVKIMYNLVNLEFTGAPHILYIKFKTNWINPEKFLLPEFSSEKEIDEFYELIQKEKWPVYYKSEHIEDEQWEGIEENGIIKAVGNNFMKILNSAYKDVLLFVHGNNDEGSVVYRPIFDRVGSYFKELYGDDMPFILMSIDNHRNDLPNFDSFNKVLPAFQHYKKDEKNSYPQFANIHDKDEEMIDWINNNLSFVGLKSDL